ncbi:MAG: hypothetical protein IPL67_10795 [Ignavibacteria bacterium]|nr:hypothetical protein [Ignavibacteria bacterium]
MAVDQFNTTSLPLTDEENEDNSTGNAIESYSYAPIAGVNGLLISFSMSLVTEASGVAASLRG